MIPLSDNSWRTFESGYRIPYDVSIPLLKLENSNSIDDQDKVLDELYEELHHQGDVGMASYLAVPHLIRIGLSKKISNWKILGLIAIIEIERHSEHNPRLPLNYENEYLKMLDKVSELAALITNWDRTFSSCALSAIAASKGHIDIAKVILEFEDEDLTEKFNDFLKNY
ncbi:hypothetical protein [Sporocytophaga myxococcoides]|uniref:hypothetical protein n=1 Tax=Sporocytophaga myxococcoides TaxID=153721 RepID=UPI000403E839|nr:hypothetical protein [Sporocytophaga myxococcoides]